MTHVYEYRPKSCQWIGSGECCSNDVLRNKSYCSEHHSRVFQVVSQECIDEMVNAIETKFPPARILFMEDDNV